MNITKSANTSWNPALVQRARGALGGVAVVRPGGRRFLSHHRKPAAVPALDGAATPPSPWPRAAHPPAGRAGGSLGGAIAFLLRWSCGCLLGLLCALPVTLRAADPDLPGATANFEMIPAGSLVIAMDTSNQAVVTPFNMKAYGLVNDLLHASIPVKWAIAVGKAHDGTDFTANASRVYPSAQAAANYAFKSGPFIVHRSFTNQALPRIAAFGNSVAVYRLTTNTLIDIRPWR
jgi:hypothetical protein